MLNSNSTPLTAPLSISPAKSCNPAVSLCPSVAKPASWTLLGGSGYSFEKANPSQIYVLQASPDPRDGGKVTAWHLNAKNPANLILATKFQMRPNDVVFVEEQPITKWNRTLQQMIPTLITTSIAAATN